MTFQDTYTCTALSSGPYSWLCDWDTALTRAAHVASENGSAVHLKDSTGLTVIVHPGGSYEPVEPAYVQ